MSEYDIRPGGSLKLKGAVIEGGVVKKKKKKSKQSTADESKSDELDRVKELLLKENEKEATPSGSERNSPAVEGSSAPRKTEAEKRFEQVQRKRMEQRIKKLAHKTHKDRVNEFNAHLESLSEHHDIPKVGPG